MPYFSIIKNVGLENVKGTEDLISSVEAIEANGGEVIGLARDENGNILPAEFFKQKDTKWSGSRYSDTLHTLY